MEMRKKKRTGCKDADGAKGQGQGERRSMPDPMSLSMVDMVLRSFPDLQLLLQRCGTAGGCRVDMRQPQHGLGH